MTPTQRRRSFKKPGYWLSLSALSLALIAVAPLGPVSRPADILPLLFWIGNACFVLLLWAFAWLGPLWGLGAMVWMALWMGLSGLAARQTELAWMPVQFLLFGWAAHRGVERWKAVLQEGAVAEERLREKLNTLEEELKRVGEVEAATEERLKRYQKLRQLANALNLALAQADLADCIAQGTAQLVGRVDQVLLYLVNPDSLDLELKRVWRRREGAPVKAKHGDAFDHWVMRQGQPLLVEDVAHDFRFEQVSEKLERPVAALLAVPLVSKDRALGVLRLESSAVRGLGPDELRLIRIAGDLASLGIENSRLYGRMAELAMTDDLTGLGVKEHFLKELEDFLKDRGPSRRGAVLLIDIDHFKEYNDQFGHSAGDKLLRGIGEILLGGRRPEDALARFGGEEFVCLLRGAGISEGTRRAEEIRARVEACPIELRRTVTRITVSVGVAACPEDGARAEELLQAADRRLYRAKNEGRNRVCASG